ncbi:MAG TPA: PEP-CTERM sorting domain-containing protein [Terriglobia bacterium]|nr:PEP-CTERM sorting domain-containing protein [Terriglobia bacterium]
MKAKCIAVLVLAVAVGFASAAMADQFSFSFNGGGITASGTLWVGQQSSNSATPPGYEITGITGTFSDTNPGANVSGAITGLYQPVSYQSNTEVTPGIALTTGGLSYDDLFYPAGDSPAICYDLDPATGKYVLTYPFSGGVFDIFGVTFNIAGTGGYVGELWSNGDVGGGPIVYAAGLANATKLLDDPNSVPGPGVPPPGEYGALSVTPTPEPSSLVLFGIGLLGLAALWTRKNTQCGM